jgi:hypothetical protein
VTGNLARTLDEVSAVADAVLFEGYLLYPYRASARKNQLRWQFGVLTPRGWAEVTGESWYARTGGRCSGPPTTLSHRPTPPAGSPRCPS